MAKVKTLKEALEELKKDEMVYLATKGGNNWLVIEPAEKILSNIERLEDFLRKRAEKFVHSSEKKINTIPSKIVEHQNEMKKLESEGSINSKDWKHHKYQISLNETSFVSAYNTRKKYQKALETWKHIADRQVNDIYKHETTIPGTSIIIEGFEDGDLWYYGEKPSIIA